MRKETIFIIGDETWAHGPFINSQASAMQYFEQLLKRLKNGERLEIAVGRKDMTKAEIAALPEL